MVRITRQRLPQRENWSSRTSTVSCRRLLILLCYGLAFGVGWFLRQLVLSGKTTIKKPKTSAEIRQSLIQKYKLRPVEQAQKAINQPGIVLEEQRPDVDLPGNTKLRSMEDKVREIYGTMQVKACKWFRRNEKGILRLVDEVECLNDDASLIVYNSLDFDRVLCGQIVAKKSTVLLHQKCEERSRLFLKDPTLDGKGQPPIVIRDEGTKPSSESIPFPDCDIPCHQVKSVLHSTVKSIGDTRWKFQKSMESSGYYDFLAVDRQAHRLDNYYATVSFNSEIPMPYFSYAEYNIQQPSVNFDDAIKGASFIARNCDSNNDREHIVTDLTAIMRVDALSSCLHNANPPHNMSMSIKTDVLKEYLFHLAFENTCEDDYITEKLWGTLKSGTLPIYYGAPNVKKHAPPNSFISWHDFNNTRALGDYLLQVATNKTLYDSYHSWRKEPLPQSFHDKFDFTHTHSTCRMCRWAYAKKYGFGWNHTTQSIQNSVLSRQVCASSNGLLTYPIVERWYKGPRLLQEADDKEQCNSNYPSEIHVESFQRTVWSHDGVVDIIILGTGEDGTLQLDLPIKGPILRKSKQHFEVQNDVSRVTILSHWSSIPKINESIVSIPITQKGEMVVRIIVEDLDTFHEGGLNETTYFADLAARDFFEPLEFFWALDPKET